MSVHQPFLDPERLARQTYLTVEESIVYLCFPSRAAIYHWADRQGIPKCRRGRVILFLRRDLDEAVCGQHGVQGNRRTAWADERRGLHRKAG